MTETNERAVSAMKEFLEALGLDLHELGMEKTPTRVAQAYAAFFSGLQEDPKEKWGDLITTQSHGMVAVRNIHFHSICEHHLLPFFGSIYIAYCPQDGKIAGFSHFADVIDVFSHRPQLQERMTDQICRSIDDVIGSRGTLVIVKGTHLCLTMSNPMAQDSDIITASSSGCLSEGTPQYTEAWKLLMEEHADD